MLFFGLTVAFQCLQDCLRLLYNVPTDLTPAEGNTLGIVEITPESYLPSDLDLFFETYLPAAVGERPTFDSIDGEHQRIGTYVMCADVPRWFPL